MVNDPGQLQCIANGRLEFFPVVVGDTLKSTGWFGGQGCRFVKGAIPTVEAGSAVNGVGILLRGSEEDQWTGLQHRTRHLPYSSETACMVMGSGWLQVDLYERFTLNGRINGLSIPIQYSVGSPMYFSNRGWFTVEPEDPDATVVGWCCTEPLKQNRYRLGVQLTR